MARPILLTLLTAALLWSGVWLLFPPAYATDDDVAMSMIVSGTGFASAPDEHIVFSNVFLGRALKAAYGRRPERSWYGGYLIATHVLAQLGLLFAMARLAPLRGLLLYVAYFLAAGLGSVTNLQFTTTAFLATQAGVLLLFSWLLHAPPARAHRIGLAVWSGTLLVLGSLVRFEAFGLALAVAAPAALVLAWRGTHREAAGAGPRARWRPALAPAAAAVAAIGLAVGARAYDRALYRADPPWAAFREFNDLLRQFVDYGRASEFTPETAPVFREVGWTRNDQRLMMQWFHPDPSVVNADKMRRILAAVPPEPKVAAWDRLTVQLGRVATNRMALPMLLVLPLMVLASLRAGHGAVLAAGLFASTAALGFLAVALKAPPHVYLSLLAWPLALGALLGSAAPRGEDEGSRAHRWLLAAALLAAAAGLLRSVVLERGESVDGIERHAALERSLAALAPKPDRLVVAWVSAFPYKAVRPFGDAGLLRGLRLFSLGWPQRTPVALDTLARLGVSDPVEALASGEALLIAPPEVTPWLERYIEQHQGRQVRFTVPLRTASFVVFQARPATAAETTP